MFNLLYLSEVDSTNAYAKRNNVKENTLIFSFNQTAGYGQRKSKWHFSRGKDLALTFVIKPKKYENNLFLLNVIASLSVLRTLQCFCSEEIKIKWPNDILINHKKISGILVENQFIGSNIERSFIGIGININSKNLGEVRFPATSLLLETGKEHNLHEIVNKILGEFENLYLTGTNLLEKYHNYLWGLGEVRRFRDAKGEFIGKIIKVLPSGSILVSDSYGKLRSYFFKEIEFL